MSFTLNASRQFNMDGHPAAAKQLCQDFFLQQIYEAQRMHDRVAACQCDHLGGEDCICLNDDDGPQDDEGINDDDGPQGDEGGNRDDNPFKLNGFDNTDHVNTASDSAGKYNGSSNADINTAKDSALTANRRNEAKPRYHKVTRREQIWRHRMVYTSGTVRHFKPSIRKMSSIDEHIYNGIRNPFVIIINNVHFKDTPVSRNGADADMENIKRLLRKANFNSIEICDSLEKNEMRAVFEQTRDLPDLVNNDGLICFIMSHGSQEGITTADRRYIKVDEITAMFCGDQCPALATKPKLFFIQACRGNVDDKGFVPRNCTIEADTQDDLNDVPVTVPNDIDFLVAYSTTKGKTSHRQYMPNHEHMKKHMPSMGSWFISCLTQVVPAYAHKEDLVTMLTRVNRAMSDLYTVEGFKQASCFLSMLTKKVYFPTLIPQDSSDED